MNILKPEVGSGIGIYTVSKPVKRYSDIASTLPEFIQFVNKAEWLKNDNRLAYAISHCQVEAHPYAFFVLNPDLVGDKKSKRGTKDTYQNFFFPSQVIINAKIIEAPDKIEASVPKRQITKTQDGKVSQSITINKQMVSNKIGLTEACMSFPHRTQKTVERYYRIRVKYQIVRKLFGIFTILVTKKEWCEGLKAHIFQHEIEHSEGKNMYYKK
jgi:hypothetical protein